MKIFYILLFVVIFGYSSQALAVAAPTVTLKAGTTSLSATGHSTDLTWTVKDATSCTSTGPWGSFMSQPTDGYAPSTGGLTLATNVFSITCTGPGGSTTATETVKISQNGYSPVINSFTATPGTRGITSGFPWQNVTLSWSASNAIQCSGIIISGDTDNTWLTELPLSGTKTVRIESNTTFQLKCIASLQSYVTPYASEIRSVTLDTSAYTGPVVNFTPVSSTITAGQSVNFAWSSPDASSCTGAGDASFGLYVTSVNGSKTITFSYPGTYNLRLNCYLPAGGSFSTQKTATVTVNPSAPSAPLGSGPGVTNPPSSGAGDTTVNLASFCQNPHTLTTNLSYGSQGSEVTILQKFLVIQHIFNAENVTGYFGDLTRTAVLSFQQMNNLGGDMVVGPATRAKINSKINILCGETSDIPVYTPPTNPTPTPPIQTIPGGSDGNNTIVTGGQVSMTATSLGNGSYRITWNGGAVSYCTSNDFYISSDSPSASGSATVTITKTTTISVSCFKPTGVVEGYITINIASGNNFSTDNSGGTTQVCAPGMLYNSVTGAKCDGATGLYNPPVSPMPSPNPVVTNPPAPPAGTGITPKFALGSKVKTVGSFVRVRATASTSGIIYGSKNNGEKGTVMKGPINAGGMNWWNINYQTDPDGWTAEKYLVLDTTSNQTPPPAPTLLTLAEHKKFYDGRVFLIASNVNVRATASATGTILGTHNSGDMGTIVADSVFADGYVWWKVDFDTGVDGWVNQDFFSRGLTNALNLNTSILSFTASKTTINYGESTTLSWVSDGTGCGLSDVPVQTIWGNESQEVKDKLNRTATSSRVVSPAATWTYTLTCIKDFGSTLGSGSAVTKTITINVNEGSGPSISSFTAVPASSATPVTSLSLSWNASANSCRIEDQNSATVVSGSSSGTTQVSPKSSGFYTLICNKDGRSAVQSLPVTVDPITLAITNYSSNTQSNVTVDVKVNGSNGSNGIVMVQKEEGFTYSWSSSNAQFCEMSQPVLSGLTTSGGGSWKENLYTTPSPGQWFLGPDTPLTITVTCRGENSQGNYVSASDTITVKLTQ